MTTSAELVAALDRATTMPYGDEKIAALERVVAHADAAELTRLGFDARMTLIEAYERHTDSWRQVPVFSWCLHTFDTEPELFDESDAELLRWYHKWTVGTLLASPRVGLAQTRAVIDDLERRFREGGHSLHAVYALRSQIAAHLGEVEQARELLARWQSAPRDENSDCLGCDPSKQAVMYSEWADWQAAVTVGEAATRTFESCLHQPERALAELMEPYLRLGRYVDAGSAHVRSYRQHRHERDAFPFIADHLRFCALSTNLDRGLDILAHHLQWLDRPYSEFSAMEFAAAGALVCQLAADAGFGDRTLRRAEQEGRPTAEVTVTALAAELAASARELAARFDARNGNGYQSSRIEAWLAAQPLPARIELPADASPVTLADAPLPGGLSEAAGRQEIVGPLTLEAITAVLDERSYRYKVSDGVVIGVWDSAQVRFMRLGDRSEILHCLVRTQQELPAARLTEAYEFCNAWNRDTLLPKAFVHDTGDGVLVLAGEANTDLRPGVSGTQLAALVDAAIATGVELAQAARQLDAEQE